MATLKWRILEQLPPLKRGEISETAYDDYIRGILSLNAGYMLTVEDLKADAFHPKGITETEEAFAHLKTCKPSGANAFLLNKRLSGYRS